MKRLSANEIRNIERDDYIFIELQKKEYWNSGEGIVCSVKEYDSGKVLIDINTNSYISTLEIPSDARKTYRYSGAGMMDSKNLKVKNIYRVI